MQGNNVFYPPARPMAIAGISKIGEENGALP